VFRFAGNDRHRTSRDASDVPPHPIAAADSHKMAKRTKKVGTYKRSARGVGPASPSVSAGF
jgi:hypothetical protein